MSEKLATIQRIRNVRVHSNADSLELCNILGWTVVIKKGEFKNDDLVVYIVIDTILPEKPEFEFLRNKNFRIKAIRLRKEYSAGIVFPLSILPSSFSDDGMVHGVGERDEFYSEGDDVTEKLGIKHYEKPMSPELAGQAVGHFPGFLRITDEDNLRSYPDAVPELYGRPYYITQKIDGSSGTYFLHNNEFGVCSRKIHLKDNETNGFWRIARKYDIENVLRKAFPDQSIAIQGEIFGEGIQKNPLGIKGIDMKLFNLFDIINRVCLDYPKLIQFSHEFNIPVVPLIETGNIYGHTLEDLIKISNEQKYPNGTPCEGIVIRPRESFYSSILKKWWSGKIINENYHE